MSEDDESENLSPRVVHNHYSQEKNGNGIVMKILLTVCGFALVLLVGMQGFMWRSQLDFQTDVTDRLARLETTVAALQRGN